MIAVEFHPKILPVGKKVECSATLPTDLSLSATPRVFLQAFEGAKGSSIGELPADAVNYSRGVLRLRLRLPAEQEYLIRILPRKTEGRPLAECRIYGIGADLAKLRPLKGDLHMHSIRSDGKELPSQMAVASRRIGLDFMALTDHRQYEPSLEAIRPFAGLPLGLAMFPGEEIHPPNNPIHMINFGGRASVNALFNDASYKSEVAAIARKLSGFKNKDQRNQYASCCWCYDKIRELGGLGIFCHPYWITGGSFNVSEALIARHLQERPFDAYEVLGGFREDEFEANTLQTARYHEERMSDVNLPIVGCSDAHGGDTGDLFGWYYTIVFAASNSLPKICDAVRQLRSVAIAALPGRPAEVVGPFRLVKLALFLMREYMPTHDRLCAREADVMQRHLGGAEDSAKHLTSIREALDHHHRRLWQR